MSNITTDLIKMLREKTGAGMMDCKKALHEVMGDIEAAIDWLRKKGLAAASKKASRIAAEGLISVATLQNKGAVVEINSETDFVARNNQFQEFVQRLAQITLSHDCATVEEALELTYSNDNSVTSVKVAEQLTQLIATIGENMSVRRLKILKVNQGVVTSYIHSALTAQLGRIGVLVALESTADAEKLNHLGKQLAMHVAAAMPQALSIDQVDPKTLERERSVHMEQAKATGRPEDIVNKMVEGRIRKFYEDSVLLEQIFVVDGKTKISEFIQNYAHEIGHPIQLTAFVRFTVGEGIEKTENSFADEVAQLCQ